MKFIHFITIFIILFHCVKNKKLQKSFEEIFGDGWHLKEMGEEGEEKEEEANLAQIMGQENEQKKRSREGHSNHQINGEGLTTTKSDQNEKEENGENEQKREIIRKFRQIKEKIKQKKGKQPRKEWNKIDCLLAKKLGTNRKYIYEWSRELGMGQKKMLTIEEKMAIIRKYWEMKRNEPKMSERKIGKALEISGRSIRRWMGQFGEMEMKRQLTVTDEQKRKIIREFRTIKLKIKQKKGKQSREEWNRIEHLLTKKLGTNRENIYKWISDLGLGQKITNNAKLAIMMKYWEMKRNDPKMSDRKIAKALKVSRESIRKWKGQLEEEKERDFMPINVP